MGATQNNNRLEEFNKKEISILITYCLHAHPWALRPLRPEFELHPTLARGEVAAMLRIATSQIDFWLSPPIHRASSLRRLRRLVAVPCSLDAAGVRFALVLAFPG
jgi:hypothetical protein